MTDDAELQRTATLLNHVFEHADPLTVSSLRWYYDENPAGRAAVGRVEEDGKRLGNYALIPNRYRSVTGEERVLGIGVDLAVDPDARGSGAFRRTVEDSYVRGTQQGFDGILGVAKRQLCTADGGDAWVEITALASGHFDSGLRANERFPINLDQRIDDRTLSMGWWRRNFSAPQHRVSLQSGHPNCFGGGSRVQVTTTASIFRMISSSSRRVHMCRNFRSGYSSESSNGGQRLRFP